MSTLSAIPEEAKEHVKMLLNTEPSLRPDADQLSKVNTKLFIDTKSILVVA